MAAAKPSAKRAAPKPAAKKAPSSISKSSEPGFAQRADGIHLPTEYVNEIVPASKLQQGLQAAQGQIKQSLHDLAALFTQDFEVSEIEITLSFSATGQFLGFGAGGALSVKVKIVPS
jgi:hypothetical protein